MASNRPTSTVGSVSAGYLSLRDLSVYSGLSIRKLRDCLIDPERPLPHYRIGGKLLVRRSEYDEWSAGFRVNTSSSLGKIVDDVMDGL